MGQGAYSSALRRRVVAEVAAAARRQGPLAGGAASGLAAKAGGGRARSDLVGARTADLRGRWLGHAREVDPPVLQAVWDQLQKKRCAPSNRNAPTSLKHVSSGKPTSPVWMPASSSSSTRPVPTPKWFGPGAAASGVGG